MPNTNSKMKSNAVNVSPMSLIATSLNGMRFAGCSPKHRDARAILLCCFICVVILTSFVFQGLYLYSTHYEDIGSAMIDIILFDGFWQLFAKIYTIFSRHVLLSNLIDTINTKFWSHENLNETQRSQIQSIYNITHASIRFYKITVLFNVLGHYVTSYLKGHGNLIMNIWVPQSMRPYIETWPVHEIAFAIESLIMGYPVMTVYIEIDTIFIITFAASLAQLKILKFHLKSLRRCTNSEQMELLVKCCKHHAMILEFFDNMEQMFSNNMLQMLGTSAVIAVIALYSCLTEQNIIRITEFIFMVIGVACQLFVFCLIGQMIQDENLSIADAAYGCHWEEIPDQEIRRTLMMMILRAQQNVNITMGGFTVLCLETFSRVKVDSHKTSSLRQASGRQPSINFLLHSHYPFNNR